MSLRVKNEVDRFWCSTPSRDILELRRIYKFPIDPDCLLVNLMRRVFKYKYVVADIIWENGFICMLDPTREQLGFIEYKPNTTTLVVIVRVPVNCNYTTKSGMLMRYIIESIETTLEYFYPKLGDVTHRLIPCSHCLLRRFDFEPYCFSYEECVEAVTSGYPVVYCNNIQSRSRSVFIESLAPDITFVDFPNIKETDLVIGEELGQGSFGTVYSGQWKGKPVAIKTIKLFNNIEKASKFWDFQQESFIMSKLEHENLVHLCGVTSTPPMMVMELIKGGDLYNYIHPIDKDDPLGRNRLNTPVASCSWYMRMKIALDIARGMEYLHNLRPNVIHRDLRSPNIFIVSLDEKEKVNAKVADFGLARLLVTDKVSGSLASWQWLPPEIIIDNGNEYDITADIYSFGIILWELVSFKYPYDEYENDARFQRHIVDGNGNDIKMLNITEVKKAIIEERLRPTIPPNCPPIIRNLIEECWQHMPKKRPNFSNIVQILAGEVKLNISTPEKFRTRKLTAEDYYNPTITINDKKLKFIVSPFRWIDTKQRFVISLAYVETTNTIWAGCSDGYIIIYDSLTLLQKGSANQNHGQRISSMITVDQNHIWSCSADGTIQAWDTRTLQRVALLTHPGERQPVKCLCKANGSEGIIIWSSSPKDKSICVWRTNFHLQETFDLVNSVHCMATNMKEFLFAGMITGEITCFNSLTLTNIGTWNAHTSVVTSLVCVSDNILWSGSDSGEISIWEFQGNGEHVIRKGTKHLHFKAVTSLNIIGKYIWSASSDHSIIIWDIETFKPLQEVFEFHRDSIQAVSQVGHDFVWSTSADAIMVVWKYDDVKEEGEFKRGIVPISKPGVRMNIVGSNRKAADVEVKDEKDLILQNEFTQNEFGDEFDEEESNGFVNERVPFNNTSIFRKKHHDRKSKLGNVLKTGIFKKN